MTFSNSRKGLVNTAFTLPLQYLNSKSYNVDLGFDMGFVVLECSL